MPTASSLAWKTSLRKVRTLWHCSRLRSVALYLWLIVVISVRQPTVAAISVSLPGAGYGQFEHKADSPIAQNSKKRAERSETDVWAESPRLSPLWLSASSSACHGLLIITGDNAITYKAQRDKNARELKLANAAITDMQMRQRDVAAPDAKYTKELADASWKWCSAWWCCRWSSPAAHQQPVSRVKPPPPPAWIMQPPPTGRHRWTGLFHPQREADHYVNRKEPRSILMSSADRVAHIDGQLMQLLWAIHTRFQRSINA